MAFEVEGTLISRSPVITGASARGEWKKQECIVEYQVGRFPAKLCLSVWGDDLINSLAAVQDGSRVKVSFDISSREFQGRWYTDLKLWKIGVVVVVGPEISSPVDTGVGFSTPVDVAPTPAAEYAMPDYSNLEAEQEEDLPF